MTVASSLELIRVSLKARAYIRVIKWQGLGGTTMIEAILVALENSLNLAGVVSHYKYFITAIGGTGESDLDAPPFGGSTECFKFLSPRCMICGPTSAVGTTTSHTLMALG